MAPKRKARGETVTQWMRSVGATKVHTGGNTTAWELYDPDFRMAHRKGEIPHTHVLIADGDYRAPMRWSDPVECVVDELDLEGEQIQSWVRQWDTMHEFADWFLSLENRALNFPRGTGAGADEFEQDGFVSFTDQ